MFLKTGGHLSVSEASWFTVENQRREAWLHAQYKKYYGDVFYIGKKSRTQVGRWPAGHSADLSLAAADAADPLPRAGLPRGNNESP